MATAIIHDELIGHEFDGHFAKPVPFAVRMNPSTRA